MSDEQKQQKRRNMVLALSIGGFVVLVFLVTVFRLSANLAQ